MKRKMLLAAICLMLVLSTVIAPVSASAKSVVKVMKITVDGARLRTGPGDYPWTKSLKKGTKVLYAGKKEKAFCYVKTSDGSTGWVFNEFLGAYGAVNSGSVYRTTGKATLYKKNSTHSSRVTSVSKNSFILVYATKGGWAYVKTMSGKGGFMQLKNLKKA